MALPETLRMANMSPCLKYRYVLGRMWDPSRPLELTWCMMNPSTADGTKDDPTIRRCIEFSKAWGYGGFAVVNLFAYRSPKPVDLLSVDDPVGPDNDLFWGHYMTKYHSVVAAWGSNARRLGQLSDDRISLLHDIAGNNLWCFGMTGNGNPLHPLYIAGDRPLQRWKLDALPKV